MSCLCGGPHFHLFTKQNMSSNKTSLQSVQVTIVHKRQCKEENTMGFNKIIPSNSPMLKRYISMFKLKCRDNHLFVENMV